MLTRGELMRIASRYDTLMAHAMLRALGKRGSRRARPEPSRVPDRRYHGLLKCFANHGSPMDLVRLAD